MTSRKNDTKYHEKLKQASIYVYHEGNAQLPVGYRVIDKAENKDGLLIKPKIPKTDFMRKPIPMAKILLLLIGERMTGKM